MISLNLKPYASYYTSNHQTLQLCQNSQNCASGSYHIFPHHLRNLQGFFLWYTESVPGRVYNDFCKLDILRRNQIALEKSNSGDKVYMRLCQTWRPDIKIQVKSGWILIYWRQRRATRTYHSLGRFLEL